MKKHILQKLSILTLVILLSNCASNKKILYFQDSENPEIVAAAANIEPTIQVGDLIYINITAANGEAAVPFNLYETPNTGIMDVGTKPLDYLVDIDGNINFPVLGELKVSGLTTKKLIELLETRLVDYIKDPVINIRYANFRVSVLGEVNNPGEITVANEHVSIIQAIALAGDLTIYGKRKTILLIRTENNEKTYNTIDLTKRNVLDSPYFYVKQNDIIYVAPNKTRVNSSVIGPSVGVMFSTISLALTIILLFTN